MNNINMRFSQEDKNNIVQRVIDFENEFSASLGISAEDLQAIKREYFLSTQHYSFEFEKLKSTLHNFALLKPYLNKRMYHTGALFQVLCQEMFELTGEQKYLPQQNYLLAAFYCDIGFLALEDSIYKDAYVSTKDITIAERHVWIGYELLKEKGLEEVAHIVKHHHEKPDGSGYLREQNHSDFLLGLLNIANGFAEGALQSNKPEIPMSCEEAIIYAMRGYTSCILFSVKEVSTIESSLRSYYQKNVR